MTNKPPPKQPVHGALSLDGDPDRIKSYYRQWAESYDTDLSGDYPAARYTAELADGAIRQSVPGATPGSLQIVDVGCGTGLVGLALSELGYETIDGFDISVEMVAKARLRGSYRDLVGGVDLNEPLPSEWERRWDGAVCCGVFTLGHVGPQALFQLANITRPGGLVVTSTRTAYYDESGYQQVSDQLVSSGRARLLSCKRDAPYIDDSDAHYWVYQAL